MTNTTFGIPRRPRHEGGEAATLSFLSVENLRTIRRAGCVRAADGYHSPCLYRRCRKPGWWVGLVEQRTMETTTPCFTTWWNRRAYRHNQFPIRQYPAREQKSTGVPLHPFRSPAREVMLVVQRTFLAIKTYVLEMGCPARLSTTRLTSRAATDGSHPWCVDVVPASVSMRQSGGERVNRSALARRPLVRLGSRRPGPCADVLVCASQ